MSHSTTATSSDIIDRVESWADRFYSSLKGFIFGHKSTTSSAVPGPTSTATLDAALTSAIEDAVTATSSHLTSQYYSPEASVIAPSAGSVMTSNLAPTTVAHVEPTRTSVPSNSIAAAPSASATASHAHHGLNVNMQTVLFAAIGAGFVILVYLLAPFVVRLLQFTVNATKLVFSVFWGSGSFQKDSEMGLTSESFSLAGNVDGEDQRLGLDKKAKSWILWYMLRYGLTFDEARVRYVERQFSKNGIAADGQPMDPKYVSY